jgi:hypothetical protein
MNRASWTAAWLLPGFALFPLHAAAEPTAVPPTTETPNPAAPAEEKRTPTETATKSPAPELPPAPPASTEVAGAKQPSGPDSTATASLPPQEPEGPLPPLVSFLRVELAVDNQWNEDPGYDFFDGDDVGTLVGLRGEVEVLEFSADVLLALELGYASGVNGDGELDLAFGDPSWTERRVFAGIVPRYEPLDWLGLHVRLHGGASFSTAEFVAQGREVEENTLDPFVAAGAGFSLQPPRLRTSKTRLRFNSVAFGIQFEGGYSFAPALALAFPDRTANGVDQRLPQSGADLGSIDRAGPYFSVSGFARF